ncbi:MAG TPA: nucleotidyltransferase domain-containing protein [Actinomycetota bacterium]|nr:nucleotidyltransferase domain-containing protein [Actinomycetota bacterium]
MDASLEGLPVKEIVEIARRNGATSVSVFGSRARGDARPDSDLDLLVDLAPSTTLFDLARMHVELTDLLDVGVDVVPRSGLKPRLRDEVLREAKPLDAA